LRETPQPGSAEFLLQMGVLDLVLDRFFRSGKRRVMQGGDEPAEDGA
jgi:hypothetical protein